MGNEQLFSVNGREWDPASRLWDLLNGAQGSVDLRGLTSGQPG